MPRSYYGSNVHLRTLRGDAICVGKTAQEAVDECRIVHGLSEVNFRGVDLKGINFAGEDLSGSFFRGCNLSKADLSGADLRGASLAKAKLLEAKLIGAKVKNTDVTGALFYPRKVDECRLVICEEMVNDMRNGKSVAVLRAANDRIALVKTGGYVQIFQSEKRTPYDCVDGATLVSVSLVRCANIRGDEAHIVIEGWDKCGRNFY